MTTEETTETEALHPAQVAKLQAETARQLAETALLDIELRKRTAEAVAAEHLADKASAEAEYQTLATEDKRETRVRNRAADINHRRIVFDAPVEESTVGKAIELLTLWFRMDPQAPIQLIVNSPGGSINDGFALVDFIRGLRAQGAVINALALGMAASMGGVLLQAASTRSIGRNAFILIHEGSLGAVGDVGKVEDRVGLMKSYGTKILALFAERAAEAAANGTAQHPITAEQIAERWDRKDWWITAEEALDLGLVDEIV